VEILVACSISVFVVLAAASAFTAINRAIMKSAAVSDAEKELDEIARFVGAAVRTAYPPALQIMPPMAIPPAGLVTAKPPALNSAFTPPQPSVRLSPAFAFPFGAPPGPPAAPAFGGPPVAGMQPCNDLLILRHRPVDHAGTTYTGTEAIYITTVCDNTQNGILPVPPNPLYSDITCTARATYVVIRSYLFFTNVAIAPLGGPLNPGWVTGIVGQLEPVYTETHYPRNIINIRNLAACFRASPASGSILMEIRGQSAGGDDWTVGRYLMVNRQQALALPLPGSSETLPPLSEM
jgi:hypothetical protein